MSMPWTCDSLLPIVERNGSMKYRRLSRFFNPLNPHNGLTRADLIEARAWMNTPGLLDFHVSALMLWPRQMVDRLKHLDDLDEEAEPLALANVQGVTAEDGRAMMVNILGNFPNWGRRMPLWTTRYLQERRRMGAGDTELAREFGTDAYKVQRWRIADLFDPLTAMPLSADVLRSRPRRILAPKA